MPAAHQNAVVSPWTVAEEVDREGGLVAMGGDRRRREDPADVVDKHVEPLDEPEPASRSVMVVPSLLLAPTVE